MTVAVVTDSTADIPASLVERLGIHVVPLTLHLGDETFEDGVTISPERFMSEVSRAEEFPTTTQPSVARFQALYEALLRDYDGVVSIHLSSRLSGTFASAEAARDRIGGQPRIAVLDSRAASMALGFPVLRAANLSAGGSAFEEVVREARRAIEQTQLAFLVDSLEYLRRGGRIGRAAEIVGTALQLKPILRLHEGIVVPHGRARTRARALSTLVSLVAEFPRIGNLAIMATPGAADLEQISAALAPLCPPERTLVTSLSPVLACHVGPNGLGVAVYEGEPLNITGSAP